MTTQIPGYTSHGHPIPGARLTAGLAPVRVARCGGPQTCGRCHSDAERYTAIREHLATIDRIVTEAEHDVAARAWAEGHAAGRRDAEAWNTHHERGLGPEPTPTTNPYTQEQP